MPEVVLKMWALGIYGIQNYFNNTTKTLFPWTSFCQECTMEFSRGWLTCDDILILIANKYVLVCSQVFRFSQSKFPIWQIATGITHMNKSSLGPSITHRKCLKGSSDQSDWEPQRWKQETHSLPWLDGWANAASLYFQFSCYIRKISLYLFKVLLVGFFYLQAIIS